MYLCGEIKIYFAIGMRGLWREFLKLIWVNVSNAMAV
jgi:hypothetical protein